MGTDPFCIFDRLKPGYTHAITTKRKGISMNNQVRVDEMASNRYQLLSPLLQEGLDQAKVRQLKEQICAQTGLSERTLRRYLSRFHQTGYQGLKPKNRGRPTLVIWAIPDDILAEAIILRREVPGRSIAQIIQILEWEKRIEPGRIKRSTLQEKLAEKGYSARHMRLYANAGIAARRFQRRSRNARSAGNISTDALPRGQQLCYSLVLECLSVFRHFVLPLSPSGFRFYRGDNYLEPEGP